ncbi:hypothetical protein M3148_10395 [Georgenia satyanarayanai]|uniref:hypothetical protein n=1 Tax=Georgenia satyanarayanai TaxID=860221 RepID=UPI00203AA3AB|nr:hypothetical protein [Georgenia satyanarayanai]MCM3661391.1 hypothetical protein [Georgenia satyanarayanai]
MGGNVTERPVARSRWWARSEPRGGQGYIGVDLAPEDAAALAATVTGERVVA